jgi:phosphatidyl-myo-inositol dimannoside synthase
MNSERKALCVLTGAYHLGGGIAAANRLVIRALCDSGYEVHILALNETNPSNIPRAKTYSGFANRKVRFTLAVWHAVLTNNFSFVFCDHVNLAATLGLTKLIFGVPVITRLNGLEVFHPLPSFEGRLGIRASTFLTAISDFTRDRVLSIFPQLYINKTELALDLTLEQLHSERDLPMKAIELVAVSGETRQLGDSVLLIVGRMASAERYKGHETLIQSLKHISEHIPQVQLVVAGGGDDMLRLRDLALRQPESIRSKIFMPGFVEDSFLRALFQTCAIFTMPSTGEGFGLVYLEAMRWSKACLGSSLDAAASIIVDGMTGVLIDDPTNPSVVANAIIQLLQDPKLVLRMGQNGFTQLTKQYLYDHFKERFITYVEHCIQHPKSPRTLN